MDTIEQGIVTTADKLAEAREALLDLARGAEMCIPLFEGAARGYMCEVERVARAALRATK